MSGTERCDEILRLIDEVLGGGDDHRTRSTEARQKCGS
jgi:hypothetical protein